MKGYLHIPTGIIFYNLNMNAILSHGTFKKVFPDWYESAFERLDDNILSKDPAFLKADFDWKAEGIHRVSKQCSILVNLPSGYVPEIAIEGYCREYMEKCQNTLLMG
jgi:hypothetical protein